MQFLCVYSQTCPPSSCSRLCIWERKLAPPEARRGLSCCLSALEGHFPVNIQWPSASVEDFFLLLSSKDVRCCVVSGRIQAASLWRRGPWAPSLRGLRPNSYLSGPKTVLPLGSRWAGPPRTPPHVCVRGFCCLLWGCPHLSSFAAFSTALLGYN
jgi:hypothetical protein